MTVVNWQELFPGLVQVVYSSLEDPHTCDEYDDDVAALKLPGGYGVDIEWIDRDKAFRLRYFKHRYDQKLADAKAATTQEVIDYVRRWVAESMNGCPQPASAPAAKSPLDGPAV